MMPRRLVVVGVVLLLMGAGLFAQGVTGQAASNVLQPEPNYVIDPAHSSIEFVVSHMVISRVRGEFKNYQVQLYWDEADPEKSYVVAEIDVNSIDTDNAKRDAHLKSPDFFDAENYPKITFRSTKIQKTDKGYVATGLLTIKGVSKEIQLPFQVLGPIVDPWGNTRLGVSASTTINRHDFGVSWNKVMDNGGLVVGDEVTIEIQAEFIKKSPREETGASN